ncbi:MAG: hypothetical protein ABUT39_03740 [Acidobacteriota bacterium]
MAVLGPLPLAGFLASLSDLGIRTTLDDQRRIALALRAGGPWTLRQLQGVLSSLLVRDREQVAEFRRRFDGFFDASLKDPILVVDLERALAELRGLAEEPKSRDRLRTLQSDPRTVKQTPPKHWRWSALAAGLALVLLQFQESTRPGPRTAAVPMKSSTAAPSTTPQDTSARTGESKKLESQNLPEVVPVSVDQELHTYPHSPVLKARFSPAPSPPFWADPRLLAGAALGYAFWLGRWLRSVPRAPAPSEAPGKGPRLFRSGLVGGGLAPRLDRQTLDRVADSLGYFRSEEGGQDLDPRASVDRTVRNGGLPTPVFQLRRRVRSVLILEDLHAEARAWNPIARELSEGLSQRGVPVLHGLFAGIPDRFRSPDGLEQRIEDLEDDRRGYLVLIFSDGKGLGPAEADFALERLARWPQVAWMQLQDRRFWDRTAARPALRGLPVFPADRKGLLQVVAAFAMERAVREPESSPESWRGRAPRPPEGSLRLHVEEILGNCLLWAQACAMAPPPISLALADRLRERFYPGLPPDRIERLITLPGSRLIAGGLKFDQPVLAVLREGFARQHGDQEAVLEFLLEQVRKAEPEDRESLAHQAWEWRLERIRLELDPESAVERLTVLALGPMRETIQADLRSRLPLRLRPRTRHADEQLVALREGKEVSPADLYRPRVWPEAGLASAAVALLALVLWRGSLPVPQDVSLLLTRNTPGLTGTALVGVEQPLGDQWVTVYSLADQNGAAWPLVGVSGQVRFSAFLPGGGLTRTTILRVPGPGTVTLELATEKRTLPCQEQFQGLGLVVTRCVPKELVSDSTPSYHVARGRPSEAWVAQIGVEVTRGAPPSSIGGALLRSGSIDVLYTVEEAKRAVAMRWIRERWQPWTRRVRLLSWAISDREEQNVSSGSLADSLNQPVPLTIPTPAEPKYSGRAGGSSRTAPPGVAPALETPGTENPIAEKPTTTEVPELVIQDLQTGGETPAAVDQAPACPGSGLTRCGDACVDLRTNPFHYRACFTIAPSLDRATAESVDSPPPWADAAIRIRRYYRLYYAWNDSKSSVIGSSLPSRSGWNRGEAPDSVQLSLSAAEIAGTGYALAITDLEIHCSGTARVASVNSERRTMYEKLSTQSNWRLFGKQDWRGSEAASTNTALVRILGPALVNWEQLCRRGR